MARFDRRLMAAAIATIALSLPTVATAADGFVAGTVEMHAGPDFGYPTVNVIPEGGDIEIFGCLNDWSWCDVAYEDDRGWVIGDSVMAEYGGRRGAIVDVAPYI